MAIIKSGLDATILTVDPTSLAARITLYNSLGIEVSSQKAVTYSATGSFTPAATPSDLVTITGSATKTVRVLSFTITTTNTAAGSQRFVLLLRKSLNAGGTFVAATAIPHDSNDPAATVTVGHYTADATTFGKGYGALNEVNVCSPVKIPVTWAGRSQDAEAEMLPLIAELPIPITLRGATDLLSINFNNAALVAGQTHDYRVVWTEE